MRNTHWTADAATRAPAHAEVMVLDPAVEHAGELVSRLRPGLELLRLQPTGDGLRQIAEALGGRRDLAALHVVCHGEPGAMILAGERVDLSALAASGDTLRGLGGTLAGGTSLMVYGCSVASGVAGRMFVAYLEAALGATVVASATPVGAPARGGDWALPGATRSIAFSPDVREAYPGLLAAITGTAGDDLLTGTADPDTLLGGDGVDTLSGGEGADVLSGGAGNDVLVFGCACDATGDTIVGGDGIDTISLPADASVDFSTAGSISGIEAVSVAGGGTAVFADLFSGQALALSGDGTFYFGASATTSFDAGAFVTSGLTAGVSALHILGDALNDDAETIVGAATFGTVVNAGGGDDEVTGGSAADTLSGSDGDDFLDGRAGDDVLEGNVGSDVLTGGDGNDMLRGGWDDDFLFGGPGKDTLSGAEGDDYLCGESGDDLLRGGDGDDDLCGGADNDTLSGGAGADTLGGGDGVDEFHVGDGDTVTDWAAGEAMVLAGAAAAAISRSGEMLRIDTDGDGNADVTITATGLDASAGFSVTVASGAARVTYAVPSSGDGGGGTEAGGIVVGDAPVPGGAGSTIRTVTNTGSSSGLAAIVENTGNDGNVVTATLPSGTAVTAEGPGPAQSAGEATGTLIAAIVARNAPGEAALVANARDYLASLAATSMLDVRTIVATASPPAPSETIVIAGSTSGGGASQSEAFVVDVTGLPAGTVLELHNIEFTSIVGSATVTGGSGDNYAVGDDAVQVISLGEGDDTLFGGGGNDTVGSAGGADRLYGDAGDDHVLGGGGADSVRGGDDQDVVYGNQGADMLYGNPGLDTLYGGQDADVAYGGQHEDVVYGNLGDDVLYGNLGGDTLYGGQGDDVLYGGSNDGSYRDPGAPDVLYGNLGNDTLVGGQGDDVLYGGDGADRFVIAATAGDDNVADFDGAAGDRVAIAADTGIDSLAALFATAGTAADGSVQFDIAGNVLVLSGVTVDELQSGWFSFG